MKKFSFIPLLLCASTLALAGCNLLGGSSSGKKSSKKKSNSAETSQVSGSSQEGGSSNSSQGGNTSTSQGGGGGATSTSQGGGGNTSTSGGSQVSYTVASAIDAVADLMTATFGETVTANHDTDGDYIVLNFGDSVTLATLKTYCDSYFIPEGFAADGAWTSAQFSDGTPVDYRDYVWSSIVLEYCVFEVTGESVEEYNGNYLQISSEAE